MSKNIKVEAVKPLQYSENKYEKGAVCLAGHIGGDLNQLLSHIDTDDEFKIQSFLNDERECFALYIECENTVFIATDRVRGYPLFYSNITGEWVVAPTGNFWEKFSGGARVSATSENAFLKTGYTLGRTTLLVGVYQLTAGEYGLFNKKSGCWTFHKYYKFQPNFQASFSKVEREEDWHARLEIAFNRSIERTIKRANGHTIWVPLSAGYDSRAVLAKLDALGYDNIQTYSYGVPNNMESVVACEIANKANVPWQFIDSTPDKYRKEFLGEDGKNFLLAGAGLSSVPAVNEYVSLKIMTRLNKFKEGDLIVNGQTGDFLTGGHIPSVTSFRGLMEFIHEKHFSLFVEVGKNAQSACSVDDTIVLLQNWAHIDYPEFFNDEADLNTLLSEYLVFEWQERQSSYVVNQQRMYEYFGINWSLPLWDADLMDLYEEVPLELQINQKLYLDYLTAWNHKGLFDEGRRPYEPWPKHKFPIVSIARIAGIIGGKSFKEKVYKKLYYFSDLYFLYGLFGHTVYSEMCYELRNPSSLVLLQYLKVLKHKLGIKNFSELEEKYSRISQ